MNDVDEELTRLAIRASLERHGYYFETIDRNDSARAEHLGRLGRAAAEEIGAEVTMAASPRRGGGVQVCLALVRTPLTPEPA
ncbi:hypothetical protein [Nocardioides antri]|uniref:Uncharacterized protein n=1 Tax=Nocardioides antri TaxID=2607659 RepID=A0A5B1M717_9ACTN|nr:hypothetical protein [Nocardioides antri]KAA1428651.1 hypothetical protein F0U47_00025 [Nocardioides antri]